MFAVGVVAALALRRHVGFLAGFLITGGFVALLAMACSYRLLFA
jgi:hypothetical protein